MLRAGLRLVAQRGLRSSALAPAVQLKMPSLSPTMETGTIVAWTKKEGEELAPGDVICEIQTDKAVMAFEVDEEGTLAKIIAPEGATDIPVGQLIALVAEEGEDWQSLEVPQESAPAPSKAKASDSDSQPSASPSQPAPPAGSGSGRNDTMGPAVRLLLKQYGLRASEVAHSGPHGLLLKGDVLQHISASGTSPVAQTSQPPSKGTSAPSAAPSSQADSGEGYTDVPLTSMRKTIAKRLRESKQTSPHAYATVDVEMGAVEALRATLRQTGTKVSVNDFIVKAVASALRAVPELNVRISADGSEVTPVEDVSVSVAVATPSGLITPIVPQADSLTVSQVSSTIRELAGRAKEGKLRPEEFIGGSCSVSNLGMFGVSEFTAIINPPQAAILSVGGARARLGPGGVPVSLARLTLCFDQRGVDQHSAGNFLRVLKDFLQEPNLMLLGAPKPLALDHDDPLSAAAAQ